MPPEYYTPASVDFAFWLAESAVKLGKPWFFNGELGQAICEYLDHPGARMLALARANAKRDINRARDRARYWQMTFFEEEEE
ncbi:MAG: hypothetical protein GYA52_04070 [Chloroflexi bacterium]|nr:hypothetical protein [Chloroflexota bacterium]